MAAAARITVLLTAVQKRRIAKRAKAAGVSTAEFFRRAVGSFRLPKEDLVLEGMIDQMNKTTGQASAAIDRALAFVEASNKRIARMERNQPKG